MLRHAWYMHAALSQPWCNHLQKRGEDESTHVQQHSCISADEQCSLTQLIHVKSLTSVADFLICICSLDLISKHYIQIKKSDQSAMPACRLTAPKVLATHPNSIMSRMSNTNNAILAEVLQESRHQDI